MGILSRFMPSTSTQRVGRKDPFWNGRKKPFVIAAIASFMLLQVLFLCNLSYLYGSLFRQEHRVHNIHVLTVDFDGGVIGKSLEAAISQLKADTFPTFDIASTAKYPSVDDVVQSVRRGEHWAAVFTHAGASQRLATALEGGESAASYDATDTLTYVWNEVRYAAVEDGTIKSSISELVQVTRVAYNYMNGTGAFQTMNKNSTAALQAFLNPISAATINIQPTTQGTRVLYNTVSMVMPIVMQFFFLLVINGISSEFKLYSHLRVLDNGIIRLALSTCYTLLGSLCMAGYIWAFREDWAVGAGQFFCTWMICWLYMHINFLVMDVATGFLPLKFMPFFVLTWVIFNITSTIWPFELSPGFYRWAYVLPAHEVWQVLIQIWSGGAVDRLYQALPILFTWEIVLFPLAVIALNHRCTSAENAHKAEEEEKRSLIVAAENRRSDSRATVSSPVDEKGSKQYAPSVPPVVQVGRVSSQSI